MTHWLLWLLLAEALAWSWFTLASPIFADWPDRGVGVSKPAGILTLQAVLWTAAWYGIRVTASLSWGVAGALLVGAALVLAAKRTRDVQVRRAVHPHVADRISAEALLIVPSIAFLWLRACNPSIAGGEKLSDFALFNAALRSPSLPLADPWFAGAPVNYYYFGYAGWAALTRMLHTPSAVAYNIVVALIPGLVASGVFSIGRSLGAGRTAAIAGACALVGLGTLAGASQISHITSGYDIWSPTRVIPGTINEFPFFTFLWADLHPHLMAMPALCVCVALSVALAFDLGRERRGAAIAAAVLLGMSTAAAVATSAWDVALLSMMVLAVAAARLRACGLAPVTIEAIAFALVGLAVALPAAKSGSPAGIRVGLASSHSPIGSFLLVQGAWLLPSAIYLAAVSSRRRLATATLAALVAGAIAASLTVGLLVLMASLAWTALVQSRARALFLVAPAVSLILAAELFFVDDRYGPAFERMNIVFKFHLSAIVLLAEAAGALVAAAWASLPRQARRVAVAVPLAAAALACAVYPAGSVLSAMRIPGPRTLDGMASLRRDHPGDAAAVEWLSAVSGSPTIVEATGEPYSYVSRISSSTGLPTILGWANHERLWRGDPASLSEIDARVKAVRTVYEGDAVRADQVLRQFGVRYVIFGDVERRLYPAARAETLNRLGRQVLERSGTSVYEVPDLSASGASGARP